MFLYALLTALLACNLPAAAAVSVGYEESINPPPVLPQPLDLLESVLYSASETAPDVPVSRRSDYTGEDRSVIIGEHNRHRRQVTPTAANMNVLVSLLLFISKKNNEKRKKDGRHVFV